MARGIYKLIAKCSNHALSVEGAPQNEGANVYQYYDNDTSAQKWRLEHTGDGYYKLTALCSEKVLMVDTLSMTAGSNVVQGTDNGTDNQ